MEGSTKVTQTPDFREELSFVPKVDVVQELCSDSKAIVRSWIKLIKSSICENQPVLRCCNSWLGYDLQRAKLFNGHKLRYDVDLNVA